MYLYIPAIDPPIMKASAGFQYLRSRNEIVADSFVILETAIAIAKNIPKMISKIKVNAIIGALCKDWPSSYWLRIYFEITTMAAQIAMQTPITAPDRSTGRSFYCRKLIIWINIKHIKLKARSCTELKIK